LIVVEVTNFFPSIKRPKREADQQAEVENKCSCTATPLACLQGADKNNFGFLTSVSLTMRLENTEDFIRHFLVRYGCVPSHSHKRACLVKARHVFFVGYSVGWGTVLQGGKLQVGIPMGSLALLLTQPLRQHHVPGTYSVPDWNEYQAASLGKDGRCPQLTILPPSCIDCLKKLTDSISWILKGL
jgi:hypothetical protein